jgi:hypothetical protein
VAHIKFDVLKTDRVLILRPFRLNIGRIGGRLSFYVLLSSSELGLVHVYF